MGYYSGMPEYDDQRRIEGRILSRQTGNYEEDVIYRFPESEALIHREGNSLMVMTVPYKHESVVHYQDGQIIHGISDHFLLKFFNATGQYQRAIYYPFSKIPLDRNEMLERYTNREEPWRNMVRRDIMPETWPAFDTFIVDDVGRIWVKMFTIDYDTSRYVVLENGGEFLADFTWPRERLIQQIKNGFLYAMEEDENGLRRIVKYEITLT